MNVRRSSTATKHAIISSSMTNVDKDNLTGISNVCVYLPLTRLAPIHTPACSVNMEYTGRIAIHLGSLCPLQGQWNLYNHRFTIRQTVCYAIYCILSFTPLSSRTRELVWNGMRYQRLPTLDADWINTSAITSGFHNWNYIKTLKFCRRLQRRF